MTRFSCSGWNNSQSCCTISDCCVCLWGVCWGFHTYPCLRFLPQCSVKKKKGEVLHRRKGCQQGVMPQSVTCILIEDKSCVLTSDQYVVWYVCVCDVSVSRQLSWGFWSNLSNISAQSCQKKYLYSSSFTLQTQRQQLSFGSLCWHKQLWSSHVMFPNQNLFAHQSRQSRVDPYSRLTMSPSFPPSPVHPFHLLFSCGTGIFLFFRFSASPVGFARSLQFGQNDWRQVRILKQRFRMCRKAWRWTPAVSFLLHPAAVSASIQKK